MNFQIVDLSSDDLMDIKYETCRNKKGDVILKNGKPELREIRKKSFVITL